MTVDIQPGCYTGIPEDDYHAGPGVSVSRLKRFAQAAAKAHAPVKETSAMKLGSVAHCLFLEPGTFEERFYVTDLKIINEAHAATKDERAKASGREIVKRSDFETACRMRDGAMRNPTVRQLLSDDASDTLVNEQSAYWIDEPTGLLCRGRVDVIRLDLHCIVDLKTAADASAHEFARAAADRGYHLQHAYYEEGIQLACGWKPEGFVFIAVEKEPPYLAACYEIAPLHIERARERLRQLRDDYAECVRTESWPGYHDGIATLELPAWAA